MDKLILTNFGKHIKKALEFKPGINIIKGKNRVGKTWILEAIPFAYYGKTKSSKIEKIVNYGAEKATVEIVGDVNIKRSRTRKLSKLEKPTKLELDNKLNLAYQEFLRMFYISARESFELFEPSYFRKFLISLFDLEKYSKTYQKLRMQKQNLEALVDAGKQVNTKLYEARALRIIKIQGYWKERLKNITGKVADLNVGIQKLYTKQGQITAKAEQLRSRANLIARDKCPTCERTFDKTKSQNELQEIKTKFLKLKELKVKVASAREKYSKAIQSFQKRQEKIHSKISKCSSLYAITKERGKEIPARGNLNRIKELESILPFFNPKGFPSYLLQIYIPVIQETANRLLRMIFPDMALEIRTTKPDSNQPDFKIFIVRNSEEVEELTDCSGSETVIINLCLRLGIMVIFKQLNKTCIETMLIDEALSKLDDVNAVKILKLLKNYIEMGYLKQVILVTHKDILKNQEGVHYIEIKEETDES